jgi:hypothetical protein
VDLRVVFLSKEIFCRSHTKGKIRRANIQGRQSNLRCAARDRFGLTTVYSVSNLYLKEHRIEYETSR